MEKVLVTGGYGFIGSNLVRMLLDQGKEVCVLDSLTYAARPGWALTHERGSEIREIRMDLSRNPDDVQAAIDLIRPSVIYHLAAESHVCRSLEGPRTFVDTNVIGTLNLLEALRKLDLKSTRFVHVSTDEVFGELTLEEEPFTRDTQIKPRSPYAASKAASDLLVQAYVHSYGLNAVITNCSNNYGPNQHEEKLIPKTILSILNGKPVTVYGTGGQVRDWISVEDHCRGLMRAAELGKPGQRYLFGGRCEMTNLEVIDRVSAAFRRILPGREVSLVFTNDRPTDDLRYAINNSNTSQELIWAPIAEFDSQIERTIQWYLKNN